MKKIPPDAANVQQRYRDALADLVLQLKRDHTVLAAILCGSLSYDEVWDKSDIDLLLICTEDLKTSKSLSLYADGINVHALMRSRSFFKSGMQGSRHSSFFHSLLSKSTLLFSHDESIEDIYNNIHHIGARDRTAQLLDAAAHVFPSLTKAEKWLHIKQDVNYSFLWILKTVEALARVEVLQQGEITTREVLQQALRHNPEFFEANYTGLINGKKTEKTMATALTAINDYLTERLWIFQPVLDYLDEAHGIRSTTEIDHYFENQMNVESAGFACEWLSEQGVIDKVGTPVRLTTKSRIEVEEIAYYYGKDAN